MQLALSILFPFLRNNCSVFTVCIGFVFGRFFRTRSFPFDLLGLVIRCWWPNYIQLLSLRWPFFCPHLPASGALHALKCGFFKIQKKEWFAACWWTAVVQRCWIWIQGIHMHIFLSRDIFEGCLCLCLCLGLIFQIVRDYISSSICKKVV